MKKRIKMVWKMRSEKKGNLPYIVVWIGRNGLLCSTDFDTIKEAESQYDWLKQLGRQPTIFAVLEKEGEGR